MSHHQILSLTQLTEEQYIDIQQLHKVCNQFEQLHIKINWDMIKHRHGDDTNDFLYYMNGTLVGYLALYIFHSGEAEVSAIVHPDYRMQNVFTELLALANQNLLVRGIPQLLFIVDHHSLSGQQMAQHLTTKFTHSEFKMQMKASEFNIQGTKDIQLSHATEDDLEELAKLDAMCFAIEQDIFMEMLKRNFANPDRIFLVYKQDNKVLGKINIIISQQNGHIYGFCVDPEFQGQGIGTAMIYAALKRYQHQVETFSLEVAGENRLALRLYEKCGFRLMSQDDYYSLPVM
jgi:ribosomal protein S18 acetylase RimI-like enzyme